MREVPGYSLWLGHAGDVRDLHALHTAGIVAVIDLALQEAPSAGMPRDLVHAKFPMLDGAGNPEWLLRAAVAMTVGLIADAVPTLIACGAGMSRSPCIAGAALARVLGIPPDEGLAIVLGNHPADVSPGLWADVRRIAG